MNQKKSCPLIEFENITVYKNERCFIFHSFTSATLQDKKHTAKRENDFKKIFVFLEI